MTRYIKRRKRPKPPWEWKGTWEHGPPRTILSNLSRPVLERITDQTLAEVGELDLLLRLYRRKTVSDTFYAHEWAEIKNSVNWIELVDQEHNLVLRIDMKSARIHGHEVGTGRWQVPLEHYSLHEQEHYV